MPLSATPSPWSGASCGHRWLSDPRRAAERCRKSQPTCSTASCSSPAGHPNVQSQAKEAFGNPDDPERFFGDVENGVANGKGWRLQGFIEAADGSLRPQSYEESLTCDGCHGAIGRGVDSVISFPRKLAADLSSDGWFHWSTER